MSVVSNDHKDFLDKLSRARRNYIASEDLTTRSLAKVLIESIEESFLHHTSLSNYCYKWSPSIKVDVNTKVWNLIIDHFQAAAAQSGQFKLNVCNDTNGFPQAIELYFE